MHRKLHVVLMGSLGAGASVVSVVFGYLVRAHPNLVKSKSNNLRIAS